MTIASPIPHAISEQHELSCQQHQTTLALAGFHALLQFALPIQTSSPLDPSDTTDTFDTSDTISPASLPGITLSA